MKEKIFKYGCIPQPEDPRDLRYVKTSASLNFDSIDLRPNCSDIKDQGNLGACSAFGSTELFNFVRNKNKLVSWNPSPLFTYYSTRKLTNQEATDSGACVRDALKSTVKDGVAMERIWPYDISKFAENPPQDVWDNAEKHQTLQYLSIDSTNKNAILNCLNEGYPFIFGIKLYQSFNSISVLFGGRVPEPNRNTEKLLGGHCMMAVGYLKNLDGSESIIVQNSWGKDWGDQGFCYIPMNYFMSNDTFDFWTIRSTESCDTDTPDPTPEPIVPPAPTPIPEPEPIVPPTPTPAPIVPPKPTPEPSPTPEPIVPPIPAPEEAISIWKKPVTYFIIFFVIASLLFLFL
jgi:hypothetical protein